MSQALDKASPLVGEGASRYDIVSDAFGMTAEAFDAEVRSKGYAVGHSSQLAARELMSWRQMNDLLSQSARRIELIQVSREGRRADRSHYTKMDPEGFGGVVMAQGISRSLREGYSVLLNSVDGYHAPATELARRLTREVGEQIVINAYVSWTSDKCFSTHFDDHDVFIIQTEGEKEWSVFEPTREAPLQRDIQCDTLSDDLNLAWSGVLRKGDVLYLPRGWWHHAKSTGQGSIHLTCGFTNRTAQDLIGMLLELACDDPLLRSDLPRSLAGDPGTGSEVYVDRLLDLIRKPGARALITQFWRRHYARLSVPQHHLLPFSLDIDRFAAGDYSLSLNSPSRELTLEVSPELVTFEACQQRWDLSPRVRPMLELFLENDSIRFSSLRTAPPGDLSQEEVVQLVFELLNDGLLTARSPASSTFS